MHDASANSAPQHAHNPAGSPQSERKTGRFATAGLRCSHGTIVDLCRDGMRIQARTAPRGSFTIEITDRNTIVYVLAEVVWSKRIGLLRKEYGLRFLETSPDAIAKLALIAQARSRQPLV